MLFVIQPAELQRQTSKVDFLYRDDWTFLLVASMIVNLKNLNWSTRTGFLFFRAEGGLGYSLFSLSPVMGISSFEILSPIGIARINYLETIQDLAFILIVIILLRANRDKFEQLRALFKAT